MKTQEEERPCLVWDTYEIWRNQVEFLMEEEGKSVEIYDCQEEKKTEAFNNE